MRPEEVRANAIVLSSGAAKGFYQLGALNLLKTRRCLDSVKYFAGTSIGAAIALLLALDFTPLEICTHACTHDINKIFEVNLNLHRFVDSWGLIDRESLKTYFTGLIETKVVDIPTFAQLKQRGKVFVCTAYCLTDNLHKVYFSYKTHPHMSVLEAALLSMNIPLVFGKAEFNGHLYIDGGAFDRLPANYLYNFIADDWEIPEMIIIDLDHSEKQQVEQCDNLQDYIKKIVTYPLQLQRGETYDKSGMHYYKIRCEEVHDSALTLKLSLQEKIHCFCTGSRKMALLIDPELEAEKAKQD